MELKSFLPYAAATLMALATCTNDDDTGGRTDGAVPIRITAGVTPPHVATRANGTAWHKDQIGVVGIVIDDNPYLTPHDRYRNMHYATTADGGVTAEFTAVDDANTIYLTDTEPELAVCAYAPYREDMPADGLIYIDTRKQSTAAEQEAIDFLYTYGVTVSKDNPTASFTNDLNAAFRHVMTRLVLKIQVDEQAGFAANDLDKITGVKIGRLCTGGRLNVLQGGALWDDQTRTDDWDITGYRHETVTSHGVTQRVYTLILIPQIPGNASDVAVPLSITLDGAEYKNDGDIKPGGLDRGHSYEYTVLVKRGGLTVTASGEDVPWTPGEVTATIDGKSFRLISTAEDLARFAADVNGGQRGLNALQTANINLQDLANSGNAEYRGLAENWVPINGGDYTTPAFTGIYNGNGFAISGLRISSVAQGDWYAGFFGKIGDGALLTGIRLEGAEITTGAVPFVGTLAGDAEAGATVSLCSATGKMEVSNSGELNVGGLVGFNNGAISCCRTNVQVTADVTPSMPSDAYAGGITGYNCNLLFGCRTRGNVTLTAGGTLLANSLYAGGISGRNTGYVNNAAHIYCCLAEGEVSAACAMAGVYVYAGGLAGYHQNGELMYSYARGAATATNSGSENTARVMAGAIVGRYYDNNTTIAYCYGAGADDKGTSNLDAAQGSIGYGTNPAARREIYKIITDDDRMALNDIPYTVYKPSAKPAYGITVKKKTIAGIYMWSSVGEGIWPVLNTNISF